jgi:hypothetical protein
MAKAALYAIRNATAVFLVASPANTVDPRTGNTEAVTQELTYSLYIEPEVDPSIRRLPGADDYGRLLTCNAVSPSKLDSRIITGTKCRITFANSTESSGIVRDTYTPFGRTGLLADVLGKSLGDSIIIEQTWRA